MHVLIINLFIRRELQLSFYANETTSPVHGRPCREGDLPSVFQQSRDGDEHSREKKKIK